MNEQNELEELRTINTALQATVMAYSNDKATLIYQRELSKVETAKLQKRIAKLEEELKASRDIPPPPQPDNTPNLTVVP